MNTGPHEYPPGSNRWIVRRAFCGRLPSSMSWFAIHGPWMAVLAATLAVWFAWSIHVTRTREHEKLMFENCEARVTELLEGAETELEGLQRGITHLERDLFDARLAATASEISPGQLLFQRQEIARRLGRLENVWEQLSGAFSKMESLAPGKDSIRKRNHIARVEEFRASLRRIKLEMDDVSQELLDAFRHRRQLAIGERMELAVSFLELVDGSETRKAEPTQCADRKEVQSPTNGNALPESPKLDASTGPRVVQKSAPPQPRPAIPRQQQVLAAQASVDLNPFRGVPVFVAVPIMLPPDPRLGMKTSARTLPRSSPLRWPHFRWNPTRWGPRPTIHYVPVPVVSCPAFPPMPPVQMYIFIPGEEFHNTQTISAIRM